MSSKDTVLSNSDQKQKKPQQQTETSATVYQSGSNNRSRGVVEDHDFFLQCLKKENAFLKKSRRPQKKKVAFHLNVEDLHP